MFYIQDQVLFYGDSGIYEDFYYMRYEEAGVNDYSNMICYLPKLGSVFYSLYKSCLN